MANIAIFRINYKSDFILTLNSDAGWMTPFCIKFWTGAPSRAYFVSFDGITYTHCAPVDGEPTKLLVQFDDHHLPIGDLKFQIGYHFTVADFPTSVEDEVLNQASVIIEVDDVPAQVMLDFNGETAPEIEFSLPAYANEAQRIANEEQRIVAEQQRIANEDARIQAEDTRQRNEQQRIQQEAARVNEFATLKSQSQAATRDANDAATLANQKAQLAADKAALADAAATLANQKAQLAADKAALANAAAQLANEKAALAQQKAEYAQQQGGYANEQGAYAKNQGDYAKSKGDYAKEQGDYAKEQGDYAKQKGDDAATQMQQQAQAFNQTQTARQTAYEQAEGTESGSVAGDGSRWGAFKTNEAARDAKVDAKVADITNLQKAVAEGAVYDISANHLTEGLPTKYANLSEALGADGANVPVDKRKGGMSVKFVQSSDNKYVQYRLMSNTFNTTPANWQGVDEEPSQSHNLVESGGTFKKITELSSALIYKSNYYCTIIQNAAKYIEDSNWYIGKPILVTDGDVVKIECPSDVGNTSPQKLAKLDSNYSLIDAYGIWNNRNISYTGNSIYLAISTRKTDGSKFKLYVNNVLVYQGIDCADYDFSNYIPDIKSDLTDAEQDIVSLQENNSEIINIIHNYNEYIISGRNSKYNDNFTIINDYTITIDADGFVVKTKYGEEIGDVGGDTSYEMTIENRGYTCYYLDITKLSTSQTTQFSEAIVKVTGKYTFNKNKLPLLIGYYRNIIYCAFLPAYINAIKNNSSCEYIISGNNNGYNNNFVFNGSNIIIGSNGFSVKKKSGQAVGYVTYVENEDTDETYTISPTGSSFCCYYVDLPKLNPSTNTSFSSAIKRISGTSITYNPHYLPLVIYYQNQLVYCAFLPAYIKNTTDTISNNIANIQSDAYKRLQEFEPDYFAYIKGKNINTATGLGGNWFDRFKIMHISDVHMYYALLKEAFDVAMSKVDMIIDTGDNSDGIGSTSEQREIAWLTNSSNAVKEYNTQNKKYLVTPGNHDVVNITKQQYFDLMTSLVTRYNNDVVWGDAEHYRSYGYVDFTGSATNGNFRIIMLDPFDYDDGQLGVTRQLESATFSQTQIDWLIDTLVDAANNGLHVITMMHYCFAPNEGANYSDDLATANANSYAIWYQDPYMIPDIIDAIQNKTTLSKTYSDSQNVTGYNITVNEDFSNVGNLDYVCHLYGHNHSKNEYWCKKRDGSKDYDILMLCESSLGRLDAMVNRVYREANTINAMQCSVLNIDTYEKKIYRVSYGAYKRFNDNLSSRVDIFSYRKS